MHHATLKSAVKKYAPLKDEGKTEAEIIEAIASDEKDFSEEDVNLIYGVINNVVESGDGADGDITQEVSERPKYTVVLSFRCKHDQQIYNPGEEYKPRDKSRAAELVKKGIIK
jgi:hypothetical protein